MLPRAITARSAPRRLFHEWVSTRLWSILILLADKDHWRDVTICDISPHASKTSSMFRRTVVGILAVIDEVHPAAADLISKHVRCVGNAALADDQYDYYYAKGLLLIDMRAVDQAEHEDGAGKAVTAARCLFEGALLGQLYAADFSLFTDPDAANAAWNRYSEEIDAFEVSTAAAVSARATRTA